MSTPSKLRQHIHYATAPDGTRLAWAESGAGPVLVKALADVRTTLVMHARGDAVVPVEEGRLLASGVLQQPSPTTPAVTPSPYARLQTLESVFRFVAPDTLIAHATELGLTLAARRIVPSPWAKAFEVLHFRRNG